MEKNSKKEKIKSDDETIEKKREALSKDLESLLTYSMLVDEIALKKAIEDLKSNAKLFFKEYFDKKKSRNETKMRERHKLADEIEGLIDTVESLLTLAQRTHELDQQIENKNGSEAELRRTLADKENLLKLDGEKLDEKDKTIGDLQNQLTEAKKKSDSILDKNIKEIQDIFSGVSAILRNLPEDKTGFFNSAHKAKALEAVVQLESQIIGEYNISQKKQVQWEDTVAFQAVKSFKSMHSAYQNAAGDVKLQVAAVESCHKEIVHRQDAMYRFAKTAFFILGVIIGGILGAGVGAGISVGLMGADLGTATGIGCVAGAAAGGSLGGSFVGHLYGSAKKSNDRLNVVADEVLEHAVKAVKRRPV